MNKALTIIGVNHRKKHSRIWIEGKRLVESGFAVGKLYDRGIAPGNTIDDKRLYLTLSQTGNYKVSGKGDKPIIDITGKVVREVFPESGDDTIKQVVEVVYGDGVITIQHPNEENI